MPMRIETEHGHLRLTWHHADQVLILQSGPI